jgi:integrase/recombinase XerD
LGRFGEGVLDVARISPSDISSFILCEARRWSIGTAKRTVTALRSLLRYLHLQGAISVDLSAAVPAVAGYRLAGLPKALDPDQVKGLLRSVDRRTPLGRRDYAVLLLMVRLGLRACEVAALDLEDVHWGQGEMTIRGKGGRQDTLPLPQDVGQALADYLRRARPSTTCRGLFLSAVAPHRRITLSAVKGTVRRAGKRIGLARLGTHRLRHTAATRMLQGGASLPEIAQVLRHRSLATTVIYAKVDRESLRPLCRPWPGGRP